MKTYNPDRWVIVKLTSKEYGNVYKILAGWSGGYLDGDSWRMSSGLEKVEEDGDYWLMKNYSGSVYKCHKHSNSFNMIMASQYSILEDVAEKNEGIEISTVTVEEFNESKSNDTAES